MASISRIIGRVGIKVIPDTGDFRQKAAADLKKIEKQLGDLEVDVVLKVSDQSKKKVAAELKTWASKLAGIDVNINVQLDQVSVARMAAELEALTKQRKVEVAPQFDKSALAGVASGIAALSGLRYTTGIIQKFRNELMNLDKIVPIIGVVSHAIAGLGAWVLGASGNLFSLSSSIAQMGQAGLAIPGILGGIAVGLGVTVAALMDFNKQVPQAKKNMSELQNTISANFWEKAAAPIRSLVDETFPILNKALVGTSARLGSFFAKFAVSTEGTLLPALPGMFKSLNTSITNASKFTDAYVGILTTLGTVGAAYLPALATWVGQLSQRFNDFLTKAADDGSLKKWIDEGIAAMKSFGSVIGATFKILSNIGKAASAAGGTTLASLATGLERIARITGTPAFQKGLTDTFSAAYTMMEKISTKAGPGVQKLVVSMANTFQKLAPLMGDTIGTAIGSIASALAQPEVSQGLESMMQGFNDMVHTLAPAMDVLMQKFEPLGGVIGALARNIGTVLAAAITTLTPVFSSVATALTPVIDKLGPVLGGIIKDLGPVFKTVGESVSALAPSLLKLVGAVKGLWDVIGPLLIPVLKIVVSILGSALKGVIDGVVMVIEGLTRSIKGVVKIFKGLWDVIAGLFSGDMSRVGDGFGKIFDGLKDVLLGTLRGVFGAIWAYLNGTVLGFLRGFGLKLLGPIAKPLGKLLKPVKKALGSAWTWLKGMWAKIVAIFKGGEGSGGGIVAVFKAIGAKLLAPFKTAFTAIWGFLKGAWNVISTIFSGAFAVIKAIVTAAWTVIKTIFQTSFTLVTGAIRLGWKVISEVFTTSFAVIKAIVTGAWTVIKTIFTTVWTVIKTLVVNGWNGIKTFFDESLSAFVNVFGKCFDGIILAAKTWWAGFKLIWTTVKDFLFATVQAIRARISAVWNGIKSVTTTVWNAIVGAIRSAWNWIKDKVSAGVAFAKKVIKTGWSNIKTNTSTIWNWIKDKISGIWNGIKNFVKSGITNAKNTVKAGWNYIKKRTSSVWNAVKSLILSVWNWIKSKISGTMSSVKSTIKSGWNNVKSATSSAWNAVKNKIMGAWNYIKGRVTQGIATAKSVMNKGWQRIKDAVNGAWDSIKRVVGDAWDSIKRTVGNKIREVIGKVKGLKTKAKNALTGLSSVLINAGKDLINGFIDGIQKKFGAVKGKLNSLTGKVKDWKGPESLDKVLLTPVGELIVDGLIKGIGNKFRDVKSVLGSLTTRIGDDAKRGAIGASVGVVMGQSIASGIEQSRGDIMSSVTSIAEQIASTLSRALSSPLTVDMSTATPKGKNVRPVDLEGRMSGIERRVSRARQATSSSNQKEAAAGITIGNITIPLEDLRQLKDLEQFMEMLRVRTRQGAI